MIQFGLDHVCCCLAAALHDGTMFTCHHHRKRTDFSGTNIRFFVYLIYCTEKDLRLMGIVVSLI